MTTRSQEQTIARNSDVLSLCSTSGRQQTCFVACADISSLAEQVELSFSLSGKGPPIELSKFNRLEIGVLASKQSIPKSQVGIALANEGDVAAAIKHVSEHLDHFRRTASEFSLQIQASHRPAATLEQLLRRSDLRRA